MNILITGGAGYIGSHVLKLIGSTCGHKITVLDNLSTGRKDAVLYGDLVKMDLADLNEVEQLLENSNFDAVIHFAAKIVVPESVQFPIKYYINNTVNSANLINLCIKHKVKKFIFSSTAAVYGEPVYIPVAEDAATIPVNPYGMSKLMTERILRDSYEKVDGFGYVILRYFNVAGASLDNSIGQSFPDATHLIKIASEVAVGKREKMYIFGDDYPTKDGSCIRDYIHVEDLANAHLLALNYLSDGGSSDIFNCGYGYGYSVKEVIERMKYVSGIDLNVENGQRRDGDPAALVADNEKIKRIIGFTPKYNDLDLICKTALAWEKKCL